MLKKTVLVAMDAEQEIANRQQDLVMLQGILLDLCGYLRKVEANLWQPFWPRARQGLESGADSEW